LERNWLAQWGEQQAPRVAWRANVGRGHSAVSVSQGRAYTLGWDGEQDTVYCFDAATGEPLWKQSYPSKTIVQWPGPRATPTVENGVVYTLGQWGQLYAWDAKTGQRKWSRQLRESYNPDIDYGFAWSPLIVGQHLLLSCGSRGLAIDKASGEIVWGDDGKFGACASPVPFAHGNVRGVVMVVTPDDREAVQIVGVDPATGRELFRSPPWPEKWGAACVDLLVSQNQIFITTAEQFRRCGRFSLVAGQLNEDWSHQRFAGYTGAAVLLGDHLYSVDARGILKCLDWKTGDEKWAQRGFDDRGTLSAADGKLLIQCGASGDLVIAAASPEGYQELRRHKVFAERGETFTTPVLTQQRIYCRSYDGETVCLDLTGK
jgi:outer membrane protein assembly factor BamB